MNSTFTQIALGNIFRAVLTAIITFFVTKNVIEADVATKLMRGDTVGLWHGTINVNMAMVINVLVGLAVPIVLPIGLGIWSRIKQAYATLVARSQKFAMSTDQLNAQVKAASVGDIIKAVAADQSPPAIQFQNVVSKAP